VRSPFFRGAALAGAGAAALFLASCERKEAGPGAAPGSLAERGRAVYQASCVACHHQDPAIAGPLGPEVKGASRELLEARILRAEYPPGYKPKRQTRMMVPMPQLKNDIDALREFLK
jgi:mono/diheme cytochrome c family protein